MLNYIQSLGEPSVFNESGLLPNSPKVMSNPLVTIESLTLDKIIAMDSPNAMNTGHLKLKFYVRGSSSSDKDFLLESFNKRRDELGEKIATAIKNCEMNATCVQGEEFKKIQKKFNQFTSSFSDSIANPNRNNVEAVYMIGQQIQSLKSISDEFENIK